MDKGKAMIFSIGGGLILMSFLNFSMPPYISAGIAVLVTILTLHDFIGNKIFNYKVADLPDDSSFLNKAFHFLTIMMSKIGLLSKGLVNLMFIFSVPISIYAAYNSHLNRTLEELNNGQQSLTLYSLGIVIIAMSFQNNNIK